MNLCRICESPLTHVCRRYCDCCRPIQRKFLAVVYKAMRHAIRDGLLAKPDGQACVDCGSPADRYDHRDYTKPLAVEPVCVKCNGRRGPGAYPRGLASAA